LQTAVVIMHGVLPDLFREVDVLLGRIKELVVIAQVSAVT